MEQRIKGTTGLLALIGSPVGHSGSPDMYNFCFRYHNLDYCYMAFDIKEDQVPAALDAMRLFKMRGCNVTMPCKTAAAQNMDELSPAARIIGAVNTIVNENGKLIGHMTDGIGFVENLRDHGVDVKGKKLVILGAGGAATAIQVQCALDGATSISIFNPDDPFLDRAKDTAAKLKNEVPDCNVQVFCLDDQEKLKEEIQNKLEQCHDTGKDPNPMAQGMSWMKTNVKLAMDESDATIADLITDGCNMGVKSLSRYLNQYQAADEETKDIAKKLIKQEEELSIHMRSFL